ncbi:MAG: hypothetical protein KAH11_10020 [Rhodospirillales bacterium]|nr:hypothetical protein [Rhodospirillales bacterium]
MRSTSSYAAVLFLILGVLPVEVAAYDLIDLRNRSEEKDYRIGFCARKTPDTMFGLPNHAFVVFSTYDSGGNLLSLRSAGWSPQPGTMKKAATRKKVNGYFSPELQSSASQNCFTVKVNSDKFKAAESHLDSAPLSLSESEFPDLTSGKFYFSYRLLEADCISFVSNVARELGLTAPARGAALPIEYIDELYGANRP